MKTRSIVPVFFCAFAIAASRADTPLSAATGYSDNKDLKTALLEAADMAAAGLSGAGPGLILVAENIGQADGVKQALMALDAMNEKWPDVPVIGVGAMNEHYSPIAFDAANTGQHACAVMMLAGDFEFEAHRVSDLPPTVWADPVKRPEEAEKYRAALLAKGRELAGKFTARDAKLMFVLGGIHNPRQRIMMEAMQATFGDDAFPVIGGGGMDDGYIYFPDGVHTRAVLALALKGPFKIGQAGRRGGRRNAAVARDMTRQAVSDGKITKPDIMFAFCCASWHHDVAEFLAELKAGAGGDIPLWGHFCGGEIGVLKHGGRHTILSDLGFVCMVQDETGDEPAPAAPANRIVLKPDKPPEIADSFLKSWMILGPFPFADRLDWNSLMTDALDEPFVENEAELDPSYSSQTEGVYWRRFVCPPHDKPEKATLVDISSVLTPPDYRAAYLYAELEAPERIEGARFLMGSDNFIKVWLNGAVVHTFTADGRGARWDDDAVEGLTLEKGVNRIVVKAAHLIHNWGFYLRVCDSQGNPLKVEY